jgi:hypothetical protein
MMARVKLRALTLSLAIGIALPCTAIAQPSTSDVALATELFNAGRDLLKDGNVAAACPKLAESARLDPKVGTLARLAECEERLGRIALARGFWQQAQNLARSTNDQRLAHVDGELARLDRIVPRIEIALAGDPPAGLVLEVDDAALGAASLGVKLPVDPGHHTIRAKAPGKKTASVEIDVKADGAVTRVVVSALADEAIVTPPPPPPSSPQPPPPAREPPPSTGGSPWRAIGIGTAVLGLVGIGTGSVFGVIAKSKRDDSNAPGGCVVDDCPPAAAKTREDARSAGNTATILFIAGSVLTAAGVTIFFLAPSNATAVRAAPRVAKDEASFSLEGSW